MKISVQTFVLSFFIAVASLFTVTAHSQQELVDFHQRLNLVFDQTHENTVAQQAIFGGIEGYGIYKLNSLIPEVDRVELNYLKAQLRKVNNAPLSEMTKIEKDQERRVIKRRLKAIEGNIGKQMGRGTARIFVRGAQLFLVLDIATRVYVLAVVDRDPAFFPAYSVFCNEVDCDSAINRVLEVQEQAYREAL